MYHSAAAAAGATQPKSCLSAPGLLKKQYSSSERSATSPRKRVTFSDVVRIKHIYGDTDILAFSKDTENQDADHNQDPSSSEDLRIKFHKCLLCNATVVEEVKLEHLLGHVYGEAHKTPGKSPVQSLPYFTLQEVLQKLRKLSSEVLKKKRCENSCICKDCDINDVTKCCDSAADSFIPESSVVNKLKKAHSTAMRIKTGNTSSTYNNSYNTNCRSKDCNMKLPEDDVSETYINPFRIITDTFALVNTLSLTHVSRSEVQSVTSLLQPYETYSIKVSAPHLQEKGSFNIQPEECKFCDKIFKTKHELNEHTNIHFNIEQEVCEFCDKTFNTKDELNEHVNAHFEMEPETCEVCGDTFETKGELHQHVEVHFEETDLRKVGDYCTGFGRSSPNHSRCDQKYHVVLLEQIQQSNEKFGVIRGCQPPSEDHSLNKHETVMCRVCHRIYSTRSMLEMHFTLQHAVDDAQVCQGRVVISKTMH